MQWSKDVEGEAIFVLETFNSSCRMYRPVMEVPFFFFFWREKMLYHSCRDWRDKRTVKKVFEF